MHIDTFKFGYCIKIVLHYNSGIVVCGCNLKPQHLSRVSITSFGSTMSVIITTNKTHPSIQPCRANPNFFNLSLPSTCHTWLGPYNDHTYTVQGMHIVGRNLPNGLTSQQYTLLLNLLCVRNTVPSGSISFIKTITVSLLKFMLPLYPESMQTAYIH